MSHSRYAALCEACRPKVPLEECTTGHLDARRCERCGGSVPRGVGCVRIPYPRCAQPLACLHLRREGNVAVVSGDSREITIVEGPVALPLCPVCNDELVEMHIRAVMVETPSRMFGLRFQPV